MKNRLAVLLSTRPRVVTRAGQEEKKEGGPFPLLSFSSKIEARKKKEERKKKKEEIGREGGRARHRRLFA